MPRISGIKFVLQRTEHEINFLMDELEHHENLLKSI